MLKKVIKIFDFNVLKKDILNHKYFNDWVLDDINDYRKRYNIYYGGGGSGKSYGAVQKVILKALFNKRKVLVIRKVGNTLRHSIYAVFKSILDKTGIGYRENKTDMTLLMFNGSVFLFKGLDDSEKIKSIADITDIMIEEASELNEDDFTQLDIRLRPLNEKYPQIFIMFNPVSKVNWVYNHWFLNVNENAKIIQSSYRDNKFLNDDYRKMLEDLKNTNPAYYKIYCLGEFATLDKLVFPIIYKQLIGAEQVRGLPLFVGMDFGYTNDPTAIVWGHYDKANKIIYIIGEYFKKGMLNDEIAETLKSLGLSKEVITADSAEQKSITEIRRNGILRIRSSVKGPNSVIYGIGRLLQNKIVVDERCTNLIEEFENYTWEKDKKTNEYINKPVDSFNHGIDALRYGLESVLKVSSIKILK